MKSLRKRLKMSQPMHVLVSRNTEEWYTPREIVERVRTVLGSITLDPASDPIPQSWIQAERYFIRADDGLSKDWFGCVFLNPPYCGSSATWAAKLIEEYRHTPETNVERFKRESPPLDAGAAKVGAFAREASDYWEKFLQLMAAQRTPIKVDLDFASRGSQ